MTFLEQTVLESGIKNELYHAVLYVLICTGMRIGEFLALDESCVDRQERYIKITKDVNIKTGKLLNRPKSESSMRRIPYLKELEPYIDIVLEHGQLTYNQVKLYFYKFFNRNGIEGVCLHSFRHSYGCIAYHVEIAPKKIQKLMGHASLDVTMNTYVDVLGSGNSPFLEYFKRYKKDVEIRHTDFWRFNPP